MPTRVLELLPDKQWLGAMVGVNGTLWSQRSAGLVFAGLDPASIRTHPVMRNSERVVLVDNAGQAEVVSSYTAAAAFADATAYWLACRAAHRAFMPSSRFDVIIPTVVPGSTFSDAPRNAQRLAFNNMLRAIHGQLCPGGDFRVWVVDVDAMQAWNTANPAHYVDGVHPEAGPTGVDLFTRGIADAILALV